MHRHRLWHVVLLNGVAMRIRVPDCHAAHAVLSARGAVFLTPLVEWAGEIRAFLRDPDGHLLEISQVR